MLTFATNERYNCWKHIMHIKFFYFFISCFCLQINIPNVDKNIYGNSRLNSPIEMTSLLPNQGNNLLIASANGIGSGGIGANGGSVRGGSENGGATGSGRNLALRVTQYTLNDVQFVEELGEGAFGTWL